MSCMQNTSNNTLEINQLPNLRFKVKDKVKGQGEFINNRKDGLWLYERSEQNIFVNWTSFKDSFVDVIHPQGWNVRKQSNFLFAVYDSLEEASILVRRWDSAEMKMTLEEYQNKSFKTFLNTNNAKTISQNVVELTLPNGLAFTSFYIINDNIGFLTFNIEQNSEMYSFTYKFKKINNITRHEIVFWDFIDHFRYKNKLVIPEDGLNFISINTRVMPD